MAYETYLCAIDCWDKIENTVRVDFETFVADGLEDLEKKIDDYYGDNFWYRVRYEILENNE